MKIKLENEKELKAVIPCLYQFDNNDKFSYAILGITNADIVVYSDMRPNEKSGDVFSYNVIDRFSHSEVNSFIFAKIKRNRQLKKFFRFDIITFDSSKAKYVYISKKDKKYIKKFRKALKKTKKIKFYKTVVDGRLGAK